MILDASVAGAWFLPDETEWLRSAANILLQRHQNGQLTEAVLHLTLAARQPAYDLFYVVLARELDDELVTADHKLVRTFGMHFPVRWLGALA